MKIVTKMKLAKALLCGRRYKLVAVGTAIFLVCHIYYTLNNRSWSWYLHTSQGSVACRTPADEMRDLIAITKDTHGILVSLNLTHFPIYGRYVQLHVLIIHIIVSCKPIFAYLSW